MFSALAVLDDPKRSFTDAVSPLLLFVVAIAILIFSIVTSGYGKGKYSNIKRLEIFQNGLLVNKKQPIKLSQVERLELKTVRNPKGNRNYYIYLLQVFLRDGKLLKFEPTITDAGIWEIDRAEVALFFGLARFSFYVPVTIDIHSGAESSYLASMIRNYELSSNFQVHVRK